MTQKCRYSAPYNRNCLNLITPAAHIFSPGATSARVVGGRELHGDYLERRREAHTGTSTLRDTADAGCFHNSTSLLLAVREMHQELKGRCGSDPITAAAIDLCESEMLRDRNSDRACANQILDLFFQRCVDVQPTHLDVPVGSGFSGRCFAVLGHDLAQQLSEKPTSRKSRDLLWAGFQPKHAPPADPVVQELTDHLVCNLGKRDQVFFIEDSESMKEHAETVRLVFRAIASIAAKVDPNRAELVFASAPDRVYKARGTTKLTRVVDNHEFRHDGAMMEAKFGNFIREVIFPGLTRTKMTPFSSRRKSTSVYIFTDGEWGGWEKASGVQRPVEELMKRLKERGLERTYLSLHFVAFGNGESGRRNLKFIDDIGRRESWHISDVKYWDQSAGAAFFGPTTEKYDEGEDAR